MIILAVIRLQLRAALIVWMPLHRACVLNLLSSSEQTEQQCSMVPQHGWRHMNPYMNVSVFEELSLAENCEARVKAAGDKAFRA